MPVLVGVGTAHDGDVEAAELMARAAEAAADDAGRRSLLGSIDRIAVPQGTWGYSDPARLLAGRLGAGGATTHFGEIGVPQQTLVNDALRAIEAGASEVALVAGGEARARARRYEATGAVAPETAQDGAAPDVVHHREPEFFAPPELAAGMVVPPVQQYALIESALRSAEGRTLDDDRDEIADLWARFNAVAERNPLAAFGTARSAAELREPGPGNRPLAFPYNKWHATQWTVDQAAALILCSAEAARRHRVGPERWAFPLVGIDATHAVSLSRRRHLHRWPAMAVLGRAAAERIGRPLAEVELIEVYSCFPSAVRVQQRELGLPLGGTPTLTGGMTFAGGPFNNFVYQATAAVVGELRRRPGAAGVVTTVCGLLTKPGLGVWTSHPDGRPPLLSDLASEAATATPSVDVVESHQGTARVVAYTVTYEGMSPARVVVLGDLDDGRRCVATATDPRLAADALASDLVGTVVRVEGTTLVP
jgi:acetyl-CoA C-acetyltransferase